jgi:hypothetical protein
MDDHTPRERPPGNELVTRTPTRDGAAVPPQLLAATDFAVGSAARATRAALRVGRFGWGATLLAGRIAASLPGADGASALVSGAAQPLVRDGRDARARVASRLQDGLQRLLAQLVPVVVDALDVDALLARVDVDRLVRRIDIDDVVARIAIDALVRRIDIDALVRHIEIDDVVARIEMDDLVRRIDIDALVARIDIDALVRRIEMDDLVRRIDVNEVVQRVDVDAIVEETELGTIVARSTSGFASAALDAARTQTVGVDTRLSRAVNRVLHRNEGDSPVGPPLLIGDADGPGAAAGGDAEDAAADGEGATGGEPATPGARPPSDEERSRR